MRVSVKWSISIIIITDTDYTVSSNEKLTYSYLVDINNYYKHTIKTVK